MIGEIDESEWGDLGKALIQSLQQAQNGEVPMGSPNLEYCYQFERGHTGGWFCNHPDCVVMYGDEDDCDHTCNCICPLCLG